MAPKNGNGNGDSPYEIVDLLFGQVSHGLNDLMDASERSAKKYEMQNKLLAQRISNQKRIRQNQIILDKKNNKLLENTNRVLKEFGIMHTEMNHELCEMHTEVSQLRADHKIFLEMLQFFIAEVSQVPANNARKRALIEKLNRQKADIPKKMGGQRISVNIGGVDGPIQEMNSSNDINIKEKRQSTTTSRGE